MKWLTYLAFLLMMVLTPVQAQTETAADKNPMQVAPVVVNGEVIFHLRGLTAYPAKQRAKTVASRIVALAEDESFDPTTLQIEELAD